MRGCSHGIETERIDSKMGIRKSWALLALFGMIGSDSQVASALLPVGGPVAADRKPG